MSIKTPALLALAGTLLLGACSQQPSAPVAAAPMPISPVTSSPAPRAAALGLYELHISAAGGKLSSSVTRVGGGKLSAQEISGLTFSAAAAENTSDASGKHYKVAITVNNGSGKDINQPLYVPVAVTGYSQNDTYFRNAKDSAGDDINPTGVTIEQADAATPLVTTSVSSSLISVPAGMTVSKVSDQAWQAPTLANGASQTVTFGFNIPTSNPTYSFNVVFGVFATPKVDHLVISQVYVNGGSAGASYVNKYVEIFNPTNSDLSLSGYSLQYGSNTSTTMSNIYRFTTTDATKSVLKPGEYRLIQGGSNGSNGSALPTPDFTAAGINPSGTGGKVALVNGTTAVSASPSAATDFVGYGSANSAEGTRASAPGLTNALFRASNGCQDTDNNATDFTAASAAPRNSASPANLCQ